MSFEALSAEERARIHAAALALLEETGVKAPPALGRRLAEAGAGEMAGDRLRLAPAGVARALQAAPRSVRLGARDAAREVLLDGRRTWAATDGCAAKVRDLDAESPRPSTLADVARSARLADALPEFDVYWSMVSAQDVPRERRVAAGYLTALRNTAKHVQMIDVARSLEAEQVASMARVLTDAGVVEGPAVSALVSVVSPLRLDPDGTEAALVLAGAGLPVVCCSMTIAGVTAPATPAGNVLQAHAESLALITVLQTVHPGAPVIYCSFASYADPRTGATNYDDPRAPWTAAAVAELGRGLGVPCFSSGGLLSLLAGPDLVSGGGLVETSTVLAYEQMVLDAASLRECRQAALRPALDDDALAVDVIRDAAPGGHFLTRPHTLKHMKSLGLRRIGADDRGRAAQEARRLLASHEVPPLPARVDAALAELAEQPPREAQA
ncbi:MAG TPA: trimethylamine methyltransferase family protein [Vicinamibacteria bacterium]|nr:trimethylamine methyltransferase family protein [Vicinamibacteria bacterium]